MIAVPSHILYDSDIAKEIFSESFKASDSQTFPKKSLYDFKKTW